MGGDQAGSAKRSGSDRSRAVSGRAVSGRRGRVSWFELGADDPDGGDVARGPRKEVKRM